MVRDVSELSRCGTQGDVAQGTNARRFEGASPLGQCAAADGPLVGTDCFGPRISRRPIQTATLPPNCAVALVSLNNPGGSSTIRWTKPRRTDLSRNTSRNEPGA